jgi:hypothetical protein
MPYLMFLTWSDYIAGSPVWMRYLPQVCGSLILLLTHVGSASARLMGYSDIVIYNEIMKDGSRPRVNIMKGCLLQLPFYMLLYYNVGQIYFPS